MKTGKYEKKPVKRQRNVADQEKKVKNPLLQTYISSLLCLLLCVTMFMGSSFAWFTSEVNNTGNEIYIGTLDVDLQMDGQSLNGSNKKVFDNTTIQWTPGHTELRTLSVVNEGDLAFNYVLNFTDGKVNGEFDAEELRTVAENFVVYVHEGAYADGETEPECFENIKKNNAWAPVMMGEKVATLADILENQIPVISGSMDDVRTDGTGATVSDDADPSDSEDTQNTYIIALHMNDGAMNTINEDGTNSLMGKKISLNVKLVAYQMTSETDGFGNAAYDNNINAVSNAEGLKTALSNGGNALLTSNVKIENADARVAMNGGVLDGDGKIITYTGDKVDGYSAGVITTSGGTVRNLMITGGQNGRALYISKLASDLYVSNCTLSGAYSFNYSSTTPTAHSLYFTNTVFKNWTSYANVVEHAYFTDCTFENTLRPYGDTTLTNCTFTTETACLDVSELKAGETITLIDCTIGGQTINAVLKAENNNVVIVGDGSSLIKVSDGKVVLNSSNG